MPQPQCRFRYVNISKKNNLKEKVSAVTSDVFSRLNKYINNGIVLAAMYQNPSMQAFCALEGIIKFVVSHSKPQCRIVIRPKIVMCSNLELYAVSPEPEQG